MQGLKKMLVEERNRLERIAEKTRKQLENAPDGTLRVSKCNKNVQYYRCALNNKQGTYIPKRNIELIRALAQKEYDKRVYRLAYKRLKQMEHILKNYEDDEVEQVYWKEHENKRSVIEPVEETWEGKLERWKNKEYQGKGFLEGASLILTDRGERVRSKTEKIMADYFYSHGIEYKYECPLNLKGIGIVYPDFTFLSKITGEEIYWEHLGMVDVPNYARKMVKKIEAYENNGIFQGEKLILTYETEESILGSAKIAQMVEKYLGVE